MKKPMTSRERVLAAISHAEPDRVPIDYMANGGINGRLMQHFGVDVAGYYSMLDALGVDYRTVHVPYIGPRLHAEIPGINVDPQWGIQTVWIQHESGGYSDFTGFPLKDATAQMLESWPMPSPDDFDYASIRDQIARYPDKCIVLGGGFGDIINTTGMIRTQEQALVDLATRDEAAMAYIDRRLAIKLEIFERSIEAAKGGIDIVLTEEDLGTQKGPMISMSMFRKLFRPRHQRFVDVAVAHGLPVMTHCCGSSSWAFEDFIEMGITIVNTLQPEATNMSPAYLKATFGDRLSFHGCISTAGPVAHGTVADVVASCRETLDIMMPGGGYCFSPTHALQDNSPTENVVAMYETARTYGRYDR